MIPGKGPMPLLDVNAALASSAVPLDLALHARATTGEVHALATTGEVHALWRARSLPGVT